MKNFRCVVDSIWKLVVSGLTFAVAGMVVAAILTAAGMRVPVMPAGASVARSEAFSLALSLLLAAGLVPLAAGLSRGYSARWLALALLVFINLGVNTVIEAAIFMPAFAKDSGQFLILMDAGATLAFGAVLARLFGPSAAAAAAGQRRGAGEWAWRVALAILAYPVIYYTFGLMVAPFVVPTYRAGVAGLVLPSPGVIVPVELGRSALYLLGSLPVIWLWARSRRGLILTLGWAFAVTTGLYGLLQAYWFPPVLRVAHSLEITADSFVYALVVVMLLKPLVGSADRAERTGPNVTVSAA
jgi:hypothetical protein